jgi:putative transposase
VKGRRKRTNRRQEHAIPAPDLVERNFAASAPNRLWTADITYVNTDEGFLYLAFILDAYSRRLVGWAMEPHLRAELVIDALQMAIWRRRPAPGLIHHSDQGIQYTSVSFGKKLEEAGMVPSMGRVGSALDNAISESFVSTLKAELVSRMRFPTRRAAKTAFLQTTWRLSTTARGCTPRSVTRAPSTSRKVEWEKLAQRKANVSVLAGEFQ